MVADWQVLGLRCSLCLFPHSAFGVSSLLTTVLTVGRVLECHLLDDNVCSAVLFVFFFRPWYQFLDWSGGMCSAREIQSDALWILSCGYRKVVVDWVDLFQSKSWRMTR